MALRSSCSIVRNRILINPSNCMKTSKALMLCSLIILLFYVLWMAFLFLGTSWERDRFGYGLIFVIPIPLFTLLLLPFYLKKRVSGEKFILCLGLTYVFSWIGFLAPLLTVTYIIETLQSYSIISRGGSFINDNVALLLLTITAILGFLQGINLMIRRINVGEYLTFIGGFFASAALCTTSGHIYYYKGSFGHRSFINELIYSFKMGYPFIWFGLFFVLYAFWLMHRNPQEGILESFKSFFFSLTSSSRNTTSDNSYLTKQQPLPNTNQS